MPNIVIPGPLPLNPFSASSIVIGNNSVGTSQVAGLTASNQAAATVGNNKYSPMTVLEGRVWNGSASKTVKLALQLKPDSTGSSDRWAHLVLWRSYDGSAYAESFRIDPSGLIFGDFPGMYNQAADSGIQVNPGGTGYFIGTKWGPVVTNGSLDLGDVTHYFGNIFVAALQHGTSVKLKSSAADGATAVSAIVDTAASWVDPAAKLLSVRNNTVEKFAIFGNGSFSSSGYTVDLTTAPSAGQAIAYDGSKYVPTTISGASQYYYTLKDYYDNLAQGKGAGSSNETHGSRFFFLTAATITGARFYWGDAAAKTIRVKLWVGGLQQKTVDVAVSGAGWYTATFASSYAAAAFTAVTVSYWETGGTLSWKFNMRSTLGGIMYDAYGWNGTNGGAPYTIRAGANFYWQSWALWASGDVFPNTEAGTERYPIEPIFSVP